LGAAVPRDDRGVKKQAPLPRDEPIHPFSLLISKSASRSRAVSKMSQLEIDTLAFRFSGFKPVRGASSSVSDRDAGRRTQQRHAGVLQFLLPVFSPP
jgi:hypothetical protein